MKNPQNSTLAENLFAVNKGDPEVVKIFAQSLTRLQEIKAKVWATISLLNFIFLILIPLYAAMTDGFPRYAWLIIPGIFLALALAATSPKGAA